MSNSETLEKGYKCLFESLGTIETERFISIIIREQNDYTKWRRLLFDGVKTDEIINDATEYVSKHPFKPKKI